MLAETQITSVTEVYTRRKNFCGIAFSNVHDEAFQSPIEINYFEIKIFKDVYGNSSSTFIAASRFGNNFVVIREAIKKLDHYLRTTFQLN